MSFPPWREVFPLQVPGPVRSRAGDSGEALPKPAGIMQMARV